MNSTLLSVAASTYLLTSSALVYADCGAALTDKFVNAQRIVDSLRPDKLGQVRVFSSDGSEFTAGQALWMKGQLRSVLRSCSQGDDASAGSRLLGVTDLLNARRRGL